MRLPYADIRVRFIPTGRRDTIVRKRRLPRSVVEDDRLFVLYLRIIKLKARIQSFNEYGIPEGRFKVYVDGIRVE